MPPTTIPEKANPYPDLPDPLTLKNGRKVTTAEIWWKQRRPEIVEDFEREVFGRVPANVPAVKWELKQTVNTQVAGVPVIAKQLVGHVDNSSYPAITVDIQMTIVTPANAKTQRAGADDVRQRCRCLPRRRRPTRTAAPPELGAAADCRGMGLRVDQPGKHPGRQRRRADARHHRAGQQEARRASPTTGARCARGPGARRADSTTWQTDPAWTSHTSASKVCRATARPRSSPPRSSRASGWCSSDRPAKAAPSCIDATSVRPSRTSPAPASITGWPATS